MSYLDEQAPSLGEVLFFPRQCVFEILKSEKCLFQVNVNFPTMFTYSSEIKQSFIFKEVVTRVKEKKPTKFYMQKQFVKEMWNNSELEHLHTCIFKK